MKYVTFDRMFSCVIPEHINHCDLNIRDYMGAQLCPTSAGFYHLTTHPQHGTMAVASGKSISLNLTSDIVEDSWLLTKLFNPDLNMSKDKFEKWICDQF